MISSTQDLPPEVVSDLSDFAKEKTPIDKSGLKRYLIFFLGGVLSLIFILISYQLISSPVIVSFTGIGEETVQASKATITFVISTTDTDVDASIKSSREKADAFKFMLLNNGVTSENISSSEASVAPVASSSPLVYQTAVSISFSTTNVSTLDELISLLYSNGAVYVSQPTLTAGDQNSLEHKALKKAMRDAKEKADLFAGENMKFVKKIVAVEQQTSGTTSTATIGSNSKDNNSNGSFIMSKAVSVSYKMW